jgi:hypothetical protein
VLPYGLSMTIAVRGVRRRLPGIMVRPGVEVEGIGPFDRRGQFWLLVYAGCGHRTQV